MKSKKRPSNRFLCNKELINFTEALAIAYGKSIREILGEDGVFVFSKEVEWFLEKGRISSIKEIEVVIKVLKDQSHNERQKTQKES